MLVVTPLPDTVIAIGPPSVIAVTSPAADTEAIEGFEDAQETAVLSIFPFESRGDAVSCTVCPISIVDFKGHKLMDATLSMSWDVCWSVDLPAHPQRDKATKRMI
jgi:hypothetical protein